jgi:hypothetical protein
MTTLLAGRSTFRDLFQELRGFFRSPIVAATRLRPISAGRAASKSVERPQGSFL